MATTITYTQQGDYLLPDLKLPEQPKVEIGAFGQRHKRYLQEHHKLIYFNLLTSCKLAAYLADIDSQANEMYDLLVQQLSEKENISEQLKADNPIEWTRPSPGLCKPPKWCRIEASNWRLKKWEKGKEVLRIRHAEKRLENCFR